jgi:hypothetical protein
MINSAEQAENKQIRMETAKNAEIQPPPLLTGQHRRCEIFIVRPIPYPKAPFRSDIIGICRPDGALILSWL